MNEIVYEPFTTEKTVQLFISEIEFSRDMVQVVRGAKNVKIITFPSTARKVLDQAFRNTSLRSVILNEGLEILGKQKKYVSGGAFYNTRLRHVTLPSTLQVLEDSTFCNCSDLRKVVIKEGSVLKTIGSNAFSDCISLRHINLPKGLDMIG